MTHQQTMLIKTAYSLIETTPENNQEVLKYNIHWIEQVLSKTQDDLESTEVKLGRTKKELLQAESKCRTYTKKYDDAIEDCDKWRIEAGTQITRGNKIAYELRCADQEIEMLRELNSRNIKPYNMDYITTKEQEKNYDTM